tara:strand:+ start:2344 stop:2568 length:225 start_codon:yes stop_codon:yes gene_type:complete
MGFLMPAPSIPSPPPLPALPPLPPDPVIKPAETKEAARAEKVAARKRGLHAANVTGGLGVLTEAPVTKKTLLGQ